MHNTPPLSRRIGLEITLGPKIGTGVISKVRIGYKDGKEYAVKYTKISPLRKREDVHKQLSNELEVLAALDHPNVIKTHGHAYSDYYVKAYKDHTEEFEIAYCLLEKARRGSLIDLIYFAGSLNEKMARFYFKQLLGVLKYMHDSDYAHRNLKMQNILLGEDCNFLVSGFRYAKRVSSFSKEAGENLSRESSMCPESLQNKKCNPVMDDLFALGYILFTMLHRNPPFGKPLPTEYQYRLIFEHRLEDFWKLFAGVKTSPQAKELLSSMLAYEAIFRPSICEIEASSWLQGETFTLEEVQKELSQKLETTEAKLKEEAVKRKKKRLQLSTAKMGMLGLKTRGYLGGATEPCKGKFKKAIEEVNASVLPITHVYSLEHPDVIEEALISYLVAVADYSKADEQKYKIEATFARQEDDVRVKIRILQVDKTMFCVSIHQTKGEIYPFLREFEEIKHFIHEEL